jgi:alpha-D-xyloside xylohydrolase
VALRGYFEHGLTVSLHTEIQTKATQLIFYEATLEEKKRNLSKLMHALAALAVAAASAAVGTPNDAPLVVRLADGGTVQLDAFGPGVRVRTAPPGAAIVDPPLQALLSVPPARRTVTEVVADGTGVVNGNLQVVVDPATGLVNATRVSDGALLLRQTALAFAAPAVPGTRNGSVSTSVSFAGHGANERVWGLGEHRLNVPDLVKPGLVPSGTTVDMLAGGAGSYFKRFEDSQVYSVSKGGDVSIPILHSSAGYSFVWNSPAFGWVNVTTSGTTWNASAGANVDFWVGTTNATAPAAGVSPVASQLAAVADVTGHAPRMPHYATGFIQCKNRYRNQTQLLDVARGYVTRGLPISVIVIDYFHWVNQGDWALNPNCWPDPAAMVAELAAYGIELMVTFWPFQTTESTHWQQYNSSGYLAPMLDGAVAPFDEGGQYLVDETSAAVRNATFEAFWQGYGQYGIKTVWLDAAEPERPDGKTLGQWRYGAGTDGEVGEAWVTQHVRTFADGFASKGIAPDEYFVLPRHAWAGSSQYSAALWSGDILSTFAELAIQVRSSQTTKKWEHCKV